MTLQVFPLISNGDHTRDLYARFKTSEVLDQASFLAPFVLADSHLLLICTGGEADIRIGHRLNHATLGKMYLILPGTAIEYTTDEVHPLQGIAIYFDMLKPLSDINKATSGSTVREIYQKGLLRSSYADELPHELFQECTRIASQLYECISVPQENRPFRIQTLMHELLTHVYAPPKESAIGDSEHTSALDQTLELIELGYAEHLSREVLAGVAGMSVWHYSRVFKNRTGISPMEYVNNIRMDRAKEMLLVPGQTIKHIASQVGFQDEFYFSRKFKKYVGVSPSTYQRQKRSKIATLSFGTTGHLLALQIIPHAALIDNRRDQHRNLFFSNIPYHLGRSKRMNPHIWQTNVELLMQASPDLILCNEYEAHTLKRTLQRIAPTIVIPWKGLSWREHFVQVASIVGQQQDAQQWLEQYDDKVIQAKEQLTHLIGKDTVSIIHIMMGHLLIYGRRNGGAVLYNDLGVSPSHDLLPGQVYRALDEQELPQMVGDRMLLIVDQDSESQQRWHKLQHTQLWQDLMPVQNQHVYLLDEMPWLDYSPYAHDQIIDETLKLFGGTQHINP
ncbi:HTH-type transcriptional activator Btr [Paenibacillus sp. GM1FR]|uniref:helix-turn-helix domain-containing protein n=1 Tax=Paenibacillus sp. GM1FR TaxID=2059267 RepID=UPI000C27B22F|nr:AraC family transcriptional regulator [Paenibacillus sp. GM1FR]PJN60538.1 HTH-type transcriptional activator Btr [Paenibacillus sp. GM1FR]